MTHRPMKRITGVEVLRPLDGTGRAEVRMFYGSHCVTMGLSGLPALLIPFSVTEVRIAARSAVTSTLLREIPIEMCRQYAVKAILGPMPDLEPMTGRKPTSEVLEAVLETCQLAEMHAVPTYYAVKKRFGISAATATRWIARAKEENHER